MAAESPGAASAGAESVSRFERVSVLGAGVLGAQIAFQTATHGFAVTAYDVGDEAVAAARDRLEGIVVRYTAEVPDADPAAVAAAAAGIRFTTDLAEAVREADLVIEAVPEHLELKRSVYGAIASAAPPHAVFATNSSTLLPSDLKAATGRPNRFLALHFANHIWAQNTAEVMGTADTDAAVFQRVVAFAREIGMVPIELHREQPGYVLNSLLVPFLGAAGTLLVRGVADPETIDRTWRIATGAPAGPFQIYDVVGLRTAHAIASTGNAESRAFADLLQRDYLDAGRFGVESGRGFYAYGPEESAAG